MTSINTILAVFTAEPRLFAASLLLLVLALFVVPYLYYRKVLRETSALLKESSARIADYNKRFPLVHDGDFGDLRNHKLFWQAITGPTLAGVQVDLTGFETGTPTLVQRLTFQYVKENAIELFQSALAAGRKTIADASPGAQADDLRITHLSLYDNESYAFDLIMKSESCARVAPDGVVVTFRDKVVSKAEILQDEEPDHETETAEVARCLARSPCNSA